MFWFMLIALVAVVAAVAMAVLGEGGPLRDAGTDRLDDRLPADRPLIRSDIDAVRLPVTVRGYRMLDVDEVLDRLGAELAERDARIAELESSLAGAPARGTTLTKQEPPAPEEPGYGGHLNGNGGNGGNGSGGAGE
ncbi:DivIVA domain-containing protein [Streptomyces sp. NBC_01477]|uniref:DivIVA domain-containing protein n=1 Tax=Streptomyces sp. NBC_01477 TaxID=2976015 RepID=UPI002E31FD59|nr:DivIVA domain-containing protein [Streptomyces sp. NBC_01477]